MATLEDELERLEAGVLGAPKTAAFLRGIDELRRRLAMGDTDVAALIRKLAAPNVEVALVNASVEAVWAGVADAAGTVALDGATDAGALDRITRSTIVRSDVLAGGLVANTAGLNDALSVALDQALRLIAGGAPASAAAAPLFGAQNRLRNTVSSAVVTAGNTGVEAVAGVVKRPMVWVAERTACVRCLAHQGVTKVVGGEFPAGLTYGSRTYDDAVAAPPLHPHCRCHLEILNDPSYAAALRREADRSVLRGFSLESESMRERLYAAEHLLKRGVDAPKTVKAYAEAAIKRGGFTKRDPRAGRTNPPRPDAGTNKPPTPPPGPPKPPTRPPTKPPAAKPPAKPVRPPTKPTSAPKPVAPTRPVPPVRPDAPPGENYTQMLDRLQRHRLAMREHYKAVRQYNATTMGPLGKRINDAPSAAAAVKLMQAKHEGIEFKGWGGKLAGLDMVKESLATIDELLDRYPTIDIATIEAVGATKARYFAQVTSFRGQFIDRDGAFRRGWATDRTKLTVNTAWMRNRERYESVMRQSVESGHFDEGGDSWRSTITHEWGHILDTNSQRLFALEAYDGAKRLARDTLEPGATSADLTEWVRSHSSKYAMTNSHEFVAEHYAHAVLDLELGHELNPVTRYVYNLIESHYGRATV